MTEVEIINDRLRVAVEGFDRVLALRSTLEVPLVHVRGAAQDPDALREPRGIRIMGSSLPGIVAAGSFYGGEWLVMDVHHAENAIRIDLDHEQYTAFILEVADPVATVREINAAIGSGADPSAR